MPHAAVLAASSHAAVRTDGVVLGTPFPRYVPHDTSKSDIARPFLVACCAEMLTDVQRCTHSPPAGMAHDGGLQGFKPRLPAAKPKQ